MLKSLERDSDTIHKERVMSKLSKMQRLKSACREKITENWPGYKKPFEYKDREFWFGLIDGKPYAWMSRDARYKSITDSLRWTNTNKTATFPIPFMMLSVWFGEYKLQWGKDGYPVKTFADFVRDLADDAIRLDAMESDMTQSQRDRSEPYPGWKAGICDAIRESVGDGDADRFE